MKSVRISFPYKSGLREISMAPSEASRLIASVCTFAKVGGLSVVDNTSFLTISLFCLGGKGGFGKLLKSQKHLGKNTTNFDSCRDLDGKKLKYAKRDAKIESLKSKNEEKKEGEQADVQPPKSVVMLDEAYISQLASIREEKRTAVAAGFHSSTDTKNEKPPQSKKIKSIALFDDDDVSE